MTGILMLDRIVYAAGVWAIVSVVDFLALEAMWHIRQLLHKRKGAEKK